MRRSIRLRLVVSGRRRRSPIDANDLRPADLEMLTFSDAEATRRLIYLQTADPYQLQLNGAERAHYLDPAQLPQSDAALLGEKTAGVVFVDDEQARTLAVSLSARPPRYQAEIHAEARVHDNNLTESYRFSIVPQGREMARVVVRFSQPRAEPIAWSMEGVNDAALHARRLSEAEQAAQGLAEGEAWEVLLPTPRSTPFEIQAVRELPLRGETPVALAALVDAETQRGSVLVRSTGGEMPGIAQPAASGVARWKCRPRVSNRRCSRHSVTNRKKTRCKRPSLRWCLCRSIRRRPLIPLGFGTRNWIRGTSAGARNTC